MVAQGYMTQVKQQVDDMRLQRDPSLLPSNKLDAYAGTFSSDLFGDVTITCGNDSLTLSYGAISAQLEHWSADTFVAHWSLKGLQEDSMIAFSPDTKTMTLLNDRAEYTRA
jgi:hypothetical protein